MAKKTLAIYRLPIPTATQIGQVRVVVDRNQQVYVDGSKVVSATPNGDFLALITANQQTYYVKSNDYQQLLPAPRGDR
ncbi:MAG TPA: hypothetical protein VFS21_12850 [Roseiflexaceae bacterium]|nr:hypothetical protein [Roseiflexaceae bacterium]